MADLPQARLQCEEQSQAATSPATPADTKDECHFFKLPPELRIIIYADVLSTVDFVQDQGPRPRLHLPALLQTCKAFQVEAAPLYKDRLANVVADSANATAATTWEYTVLLRITKTRPNLRRRLTLALTRQMRYTQRYHTECDNLVRKKVLDLGKSLGMTLGPVEGKVAMLLGRCMDKFRTASEAFADEVKS